MQSQGLFSLDEEYAPHPDRIEPAVWICELAILSQPAADGELRVVPFHRGLNVVRAEERNDNEEDVVAHSVGKTLLMRLIRYSVGEPNYTSEESQVDIAAALPNAAIVAHWRVQSEDWIVFRPLHDHDPAASYCVRASSWKAAFDEQLDRIAFKPFCNSVDAAVTKELPHFENSKGRRVAWPDILGWLARDCECGYRQANEWRHPDTNLGKPSDLTDNSQMLQWLCGLINQTEAELRKGHRQLLSERSKAKSLVERETRTIEVAEDNLRRSMEIPKSSEDSEQKSLEPFIGTPEPEPSLSDRAKSMIDQLAEILTEVENQSHIGELEKKEVKLQAEFDQANQDTGVASGDLMAARAYQRLLKASSDIPAFLTKCPAKACEYVELLKRRNEAGKDEAREENLRNMEDEIPEKEAKEKSSRELRDKLFEDLKKVRSDLPEARAKLSQARNDINEKIGKWKVHLQDAEAFNLANIELVAHSSRLSELNEAVDDSSSKLDAARDSMDVKQRAANLTNYYSQVLRRVFGPTASGSIQVDGNGLQPKPAKKLAPGGRALSAMASVVSFDLACVMASIAGVGHHPRFLIHDSPREGEMEMPLFQKLFDVACFLESVFPDVEPSFQYIVTTTKAPPEFCEEGEPHTCVTLHGRSVDGRLLKLKF